MSQDNILANLIADTIQNPPAPPVNPATLSLSKKILLASEWRFKGVPIQAIAGHFNVSYRTVYNWIKKGREHFLEELENQPASELICGHLADLQRMEQMCMYEAAHIGQDTLEFDPVKKVHVKKKGSLREKAEFMRLAAMYRKMQIDLSQTTGILPKQAEKIYTKLVDQRHSLDDVDKSALIINSEETVKNILDKIKHQTIL